MGIEPLEPSVHRNFRCQCGRPVFFDNSVCLACGTQLGYVASRGEVIPLVPGAMPESWQPFVGVDDPAILYRCDNFESAAGCNWMIDADDQERGKLLCVACRLNRTIPDLTIADNALLWRRIESAKRRLVSALLALNLPVHSRIEDTEHGLMFDFLRAPRSGGGVLTGHDNGLITLNIEEADDSKREKTRAAMHEPYRTLLGHLRHEIGHYYWDVLVDNTPWLRGYRDLFGDERTDYALALTHHYETGPNDDWPLHFVSSYASSHPWEDWAETWAHYLHMLDTLDTALSFGLDAASVELEIEPFGTDALYQPDAEDADEFLSFINAATRLTGVLNELSRSMGQHDFYPFVLSKEAVRKLQFVHQVIHGYSATSAAPLAAESLRL